MNSRLVRDVLINIFASSVVAFALYFFGVVSVTVAVIVALSIALFVSLLLLSRGPGRKLKTLVGVKDVTAGPNHNVEQMLDGARHSIDFLGVTANRTARSQMSKEAMQRVAENSGRIRFLLLNPASEHLTRRAEDEGDDAESWRTEIAGTVRRLRALRNDGANLAVRYYDCYPLFRLVNLDNTEMQINWFLDGRQGHHSPELTLVVDRVGLSAALARHFEELWKTGVDAFEAEPALPDSFDVEGNVQHQGNV